MPMMPEMRNQLVDFSPTGVLPDLEEVGVALTCRPGTGTAARVPAGTTVTLTGAYLADGDMLRACPEGVGLALEILLERTDTPAAWAEMLIEELVTVVPPIDEPTYGPNYRERGAFSLDPGAFFELPAEPSVYRARVGIAIRYGLSTESINELGALQWPQSVYWALTALAADPPQPRAAFRGKIRRLLPPDAPPEVVPIAMVRSAQGDWLSDWVTIEYTV